MDAAIQRLADFGAAMLISGIVIAFLIKFVEKLFDKFTALMDKVVALFESNQQVIKDNTTALTANALAQARLDTTLTALEGRVEVLETKFDVQVTELAKHREREERILRKGRKEPDETESSV
jgi:hypothetical protein